MAKSPTAKFSRVNTRRDLSELAETSIFLGFRRLRVQWRYSRASAIDTFYTRWSSFLKNALKLARFPKSTPLEVVTEASSNLVEKSTKISYFVAQNFESVTQSVSALAGAQSSKRPLSKD